MDYPPSAVSYAVLQLQSLNVIYRRAQGASSKGHSTRAKPTEFDRVLTVTLINHNSGKLRGVRTDVS